MLHQLVTSDELHDWIVEEVRRRPNCADFAAAFTFVRLPTPDAQGRTWRVQGLIGEQVWDAATLGAFETAVRHARRAFDLIE